MKKQTIIISIILILIAIIIFVTVSIINLFTGSFFVGFIVADMAEQSHWDHSNITYTIVNKSCYSNEIFILEVAFYKIQNAVDNVVTFIKIEDNADISISCVKEIPCLNNCFGLDTKGVTKLNIKGNKIISADIYFRRIHAPFSINMGYEEIHLVETHEILHAIGFKHSNNPKSVMYLGTSQCLEGTSEIDQEIINKIKEIYTN